MVIVSVKAKKPQIRVECDNLIDNVDYRVYALSQSRDDIYPIKGVWSNSPPMTSISSSASEPSPSPQEPGSMIGGTGEALKPPNTSTSSSSSQLPVDHSMSTSRMEREG